jgi:ABC-type multidrug transport system fused ATPase/permease subunit
MRNVLRAFGYLRPHWPLAILSVVILVVDALVDLLTPWPLKIVVDNALGNELLPPMVAAPLGALANDRAAILVFAVVGGLVITIVNNSLTVLNSYIQTRIEQRMVLACRSDLFEHAQRLSLTFHDQNRTGDFMYRINFQAAAVGDIVMTIPPLVQSAITLVGMLWISYHIDWQLTLLAMIVVPFLYYSIGYYASHVHPRVMHARGLEMQSLNIVHEAMAMMRVIIAFTRESHEQHRFREQGEEAVDARVKVTVRQTMFTLAVTVITAVGTTLVLGFGAYRVLQGDLTLGQLLVIMAYIAAIYSPLQAISSAVAPISDHLVNLRMAFELLDTEPEIKDAPDAISIDRAVGHVRFEDIHFSYPGRVDTLKGISFEAPAGHVVAIVGPTGAGKTTLMSLLPRFYDPKQGRILLDGIDTRKLKVESLRAQISVVLQEPLLFSGTIADNIRYGRLEASMDEVMQAARDANAHEFITGLPEQYETMLGERGAKLSGGERQRIAVARAFLKDAPILILDEPTSAIDSKTEAVILEALERLMRGRTTFMIAHRLSTIRDADLIVVLNRGQLVETGTHEELLDLGGMYRQLHDVQTRSAAQRRVRPALAAVPPTTERSA